MKKFVAILLSVALLISVAVLPASATTADETVRVTSADSLDSAFAEGENSLILFVTGIGQSYSYLFDESYLAPDAFENGTLQDFENYAPLIAQGKYTARWNLFCNKFDSALKNPKTIFAIAGVVFNLLLSAFTRKDTVKEKDVYTIVENLFAANIVDENGKCDPKLVTPRYAMPVSEYPVAPGENGELRSEAKERFYSSIPCAEIVESRLGENYEDYLYCFNYCAFSHTKDNVQGLHDYIETVLRTNKVGATEVVLIPMSMGASVVSSYLAKYPNRSDNHVRRVVSIVGCWQGSDIVYDLLTRNYTDNSAELFYNGIIADMVGEPWGYLVNFALRLFPKAGLRALVDKALKAFADTILLPAPSLCALVPSYRYEEIRPLIKSDVVRAQTDAYQQAQLSLHDRFEALEAQGITVSFIAGYGLPYGAITGDYKAFGFMKSAPLTNSDEIINISSTVPGTQYVAYNDSFANYAPGARRLSPDGSVDISSAYYPDSCWLFRGQKHELEHNNTAISLAIELALGNIKTVQDCDNLEEDGYYYPQFNNARDLKRLKRNYIPDLERYCEANDYTLTEAQQALYDEVIAMTENTVNDFENDNKLIDRFNDMLIEIGVYGAPEQPSGIEKLAGDAMKKGNDIIFMLFGAKGFIDF